MEWFITIAILSFIGWTHAAIIRLRKRNSANNKYVFSMAIILYLTCNLIQAHTFTYKTWFNVAFILYSLIAIPFHVWLMVSWTKATKTTSH